MIPRAAVEVAHTFLAIAISMVIVLMLVTMPLWGTALALGSWRQRAAALRASRRRAGVARAG